MNWEFDKQLDMWTGLSSVAKPTLIDRDMKAYEYDTGNIYIWDGDSWELKTPNPTERVTKSLKTIDTDHAYIHEGIGFDLFVKQTVLAGASAYIQLTTPSDKYIQHNFFWYDEDAG